MIFKMPVSKESYTKAILNVANSTLHLAPKEMDVLVVMIDNDIKTLDTEERKKIRKVMSIDQATLNNYIHKLKSKNALTKTKYGLSIHSVLLNVVKDKTITFSFETH